MGRVIIRTARPTSGTCKQATATGRITTKTWCHCSSSVVRTSFYAALQHWHRWYNVPNIVDKPTNEQLGLRAQHHGTKGASESTRRCLHVMKFSGGGSQDLQSRARGILAPNSNGPEGPLNERVPVVDRCTVRPAFQTVRNSLCGLADLFQLQLRGCKPFAMAAMVRLSLASPTRRNHALVSGSRCPSFRHPYFRRLLHSASAHARPHYWMGNTRKEPSIEPYRAGGSVGNWLGPRLTCASDHFTCHDTFWPCLRCITKLEPIPYGVLARRNRNQAGVAWFRTLTPCTTDAEQYDHGSRRQVVGVQCTLKVATYRPSNHGCVAAISPHKSHRQHKCFRSFTRSTHCRAQITPTRINPAAHVVNPGVHNVVFEADAEFPHPPK